MLTLFSFVKPRLENMLLICMLPHTLFSDKWLINAGDQIGSMAQRITPYLTSSAKLTHQLTIGANATPRSTPTAH